MRRQNKEVEKANEGDRVDEQGQNDKGVLTPTETTPKEDANITPA